MELLRNAFQQMFENIMNTESAKLFTTLCMVGIWILVGVIFSLVIKPIINRIIYKNKPKDRRKKTISGLINSIVHIVFLFFIVIMILEELNINIVPVIASAGVLAFAVGFGAQELVKDFISGFFIIIEHSFDIDDIIEIDGFKGKVSEIGFRKTKIVNWKNEVKTINNGDVRNVINYSLKSGIGSVEIGVKYGSKLDVFQSREFEKLLIDFKDDNELLKSIPIYKGPIAINRRTVIIRVTFECEAEKQAVCEIKLREKIITYCISKNIEFF